MNGSNVFTLPPDLQRDWRRVRAAIEQSAAAAGVSPAVGVAIAGAVEPQWRAIVAAAAAEPDPGKRQATALSQAFSLLIVAHIELHFTRLAARAAGALGELAASVPEGAGRPAAQDLPPGAAPVTAEGPPDPGAA